MDFKLKTRKERIDEEIDAMYWRSVNELEEQSCLNKLNSGMSCREYCSYYKTDKCRHPERVFPYTQKRH